MRPLIGEPKPVTSKKLQDTVTRIGAVSLSAVRGRC